MELSPEERQRRSDRAKELHAKGKFGGAQPGSGRPRKKRASELVAEAAAQDAQNIIDAFRRGVASEDEKVAVMAAEKYLGVEDREQSRQEREEQRMAALSKDEIVAELASGFARLAARGVNFDFESEAEEDTVDALPEEAQVVG